MAREVQEILDEIAQELVDGSDEGPERAHYFLSIMSDEGLSQYFEEGTAVHQWFEGFFSVFDNELSAESSRNFLATCPFQLPDVIKKAFDEIIAILPPQ